MGESQGAAPTTTQSEQSNAVTITDAPSAHTGRDLTKGNKYGGDKRGNKGKYFLDISNKDFEGDTPDIGCVVGLKSEKITAKVQFDTFRDKVGDYALKVLRHGMDVVPKFKNDIL